MIGPIAAWLLAAGVAFAATPLAIRVATRTGFLDHPVGYKAHRAPTPYLGGVAVFLGFAVAAVSLGHGSGRLAVVLVCGAVMLAVGTLDDRIPVRPRWRVLVEVAGAVALSEAGLGWNVFGSDFANLLLTVAWIVGLVNAFNLLDNLDGATPTVGAVSAAGIGVVALDKGDVTLAAFAFAIGGACVGFLPRNLSKPARIFLGDGGSMSLGFLVAACAMIAAEDKLAGGGATLLAGALLVGLPILDTTLVVLSRRRAGIGILTGGRDHVTHRLLSRLRTPRRVAGALAGIQAALCVVAISGVAGGDLILAVGATACAALGVVAIGILESPGW